MAEAMDTPEHTDSPSSQAKKRTRLPSSCLVCRKRKIKCNKARPSCDQCLSAEIAHICHYDDPQWLSKLSRDNTTAKSSASSDGTENLPVAALQKVDELVHRIKQLEKAMRESGATLPDSAPVAHKYDPDDKVLFVDNVPFLVPAVLRSARIEYHGCMSSIFDTKTDPYLKIIWLNMWKYLDMAVKSRAGAAEHVPINFKTTTVDSTVLEFLKLRRQKVAFKLLCLKVLRNPKERLTEILLENLPEKRTILYLLEIFFAKVYPLVPVVNKYKLISEELEKILGGWTATYQKPTVIHIEESQDIATMGMLFSLMAIACLTVNDAEVENVPDLTPLKDMCPALFAQVAQCCVDQVCTLRKASRLRLGMVVLLLKFYNTHCPENDAAPEMSGGMIQSGLMITLARTNGAFADLNIAEKFQEEAFTQHYKTWRHYWHYVVSQDAIESVLSGTLPRFMDDMSYDTELPSHEVGEPSMETAVVTDYEYLDRQTKLFRKLAVALYQRKNSPSIEKLLSLIEELKEFTEKELGSLTSVLSKNTDPCMSAKQAGYLMDLYALETGLRQRAISHFCLLQNSTMIHEQFAIQVVSLTKMYAMVMNVAYNTDKYFGNHYQFYLRPKLLYSLIRLMMSFGALVARCTQSLTRLTMEHQTRQRSLRNMKERATNTMSRCLELMVKINHGYFDAKKITIGFSFFVTMLQDPAFDFNKAEQDVKTKIQVREEIKAYYFQGTKGQGVSDQHNFLDDLLIAEIDFMTAQLPGDIAEIVQPHFGQFGQRVHIDLSKPLFTKEASHLSNYFGKKSTTSEFDDDAERKIQKSLALRYMTHKVDSIFAGSDTIKARSVGMTPGEMAGYDTPQAGSNDDDDQVTVTGDEFGDLFGLFDDFHWAGTNSVVDLNEELGYI